MIPPKDPVSPLESVLPPLPIPSTQTVPEQAGLAEKVSFDAPQNWGTSTLDTSPTEPVIAPAVPTDNIPSMASPTSAVIPGMPAPTATSGIRNPGSSSESDSSPSFLKILLISVCLILLGALLGVLAAKFYQPVAPKVIPPSAVIQPTPTTAPVVATDSATIPVMDINSSPMATPASLLNVQWKSYSTKLYKLFYPSTWTKKNTSTSLILTIKSKADMSTADISISVPDKNIQGASCNVKSVFKIQKDQYLWDIQELSPSTYVVCDSNKDYTVIGTIDLGSAKDIDKAILDEFKYILEKIELLPATSSATKKATAS